MSFSVYDVVRLTHPLAEHSLEVGAIGTVVMVYENASGYEIEFVDSAGATLALLSLTRGEAEAALELDSRK
jgi:hypothetical protein